MKITVLIATTLALGAVAAPVAQAAPSGTIYEVTVTGNQQFDQTDTEVPDARADKCFDAKGTTTQKSVVNFASNAPERVRVIRTGRTFRIEPIGGQAAGVYDWPITATFNHSGNENRQVKKLDCRTWVQAEPRQSKNCSATLDNYGGDVGNYIPKSRKVTFSGGVGLPPIPPMDDAFTGCLWGDLSLGLYRAKGKIDPEVILSSVASAFVLKGEEKDTVKTPGGDSTSWVKTTTVRVKFKRVKGL